MKKAVKYYGLTRSLSSSFVPLQNISSSKFIKFKHVMIARIIAVKPIAKITAINANTTEHISTETTNIHTKDFNVTGYIHTKLRALCIKNSPFLNSYYQKILLVKIPFTVTITNAENFDVTESLPIHILDAYVRRLSSHVLFVNFYTTLGTIATDMPKINEGLLL